MKKNISYLSIGTNIGNLLKNLNEVISLINENDSVEIDKISSIYKTSPVGSIKQDDFYNIVIKISTPLSPFNLLHFINSLENKMGRVRNIYWGPRIIDIDIITFNNISISTRNLTIPHKEFKNRKFVLTPLKEIISNKKLVKKYNLMELILNKNQTNDKISKIKDRVVINEIK